MIVSVKLVQKRGDRMCCWKAPSTTPNSIESLTKRVMRGARWSKQGLSSSMGIGSRAELLSGDLICSFIFHFVFGLRSVQALIKRERDRK